MPKTFVQAVDFPGVTAGELFRTYLTAERHAAAIGAPAEIEAEVGGRFKIFGDDAVSGTTLAIEKDRLIVQLWRGQAWSPDDQDSVLVLRFDEIEAGATIILSQVNVPDQAYELVNPDAWNKLYWDRWRAYFAQGRARLN